jgi:hypothetical protein
MMHLEKSSATHDEDTAKEEISLGGDGIQGDRHDSNNGEGAEPLPHQADSHRDRSVSYVEDLGDQGEGDRVPTEA